MRPRRRTGGARGLGSGGTGRGRGTRLGRDPGLDPGDRKPGTPRRGRSPCPADAEVRFRFRAWRAVIVIRRSDRGGRQGVHRGTPSGMVNEQGPHPASPGDLRQEHHGNPAQPIGFHKKLLARPNRITIDSSCGNLAASSTLYRFIDSHDQWPTAWKKQANQQPQQNATHLSTRPVGAIEDASDAFWNCFSFEHPITRKMAATVRSPGARIAPIKSTLAHSHTRSLKTTSKWRNTCIILLGNVSISSFFLC